MSILRDYSDHSDAQLEEDLRNRAVAEDCELVVERLDETGEWRAAFKRFDVAPDELAPQGVILKSAQAVEKRQAFLDLLSLLDDQ